MLSHEDVRLRRSWCNGKRFQGYWSILAGRNYFYLINLSVCCLAVEDKEATVISDFHLQHPVVFFMLTKVHIFWCAMQDYVIWWSVTSLGTMRWCFPVQAISVCNRGRNALPIRDLLSPPLLGASEHLSSRGFLSLFVSGPGAFSQEHHLKLQGALFVFSIKMNDK